MKQKKYLLFFPFGIAGLVVLIDQLLKWLVVKNSVNLDLGFVLFHLVKNTGAGFGILQGRTILLGFVSLIAAVALIYYHKEIPKDKVSQTFYGLLLGGIIGNGIDRFFRDAVIDFIDLGWWPAFNIADSAIVVSVIWLVWIMWNDGKEKN